MTRQEAIEANRKLCLLWADDSDCDDAIEALRKLAAEPDLMPETARKFAADWRLRGTRRARETATMLYRLANKLHGGQAETIHDVMPRVLAWAIEAGRQCLDIDGAPDDDDGLMGLQQAYMAAFPCHSLRPDEHRTLLLSSMYHAFRSTVREFEKWRKLPPPKFHAFVQSRRFVADLQVEFGKGIVKCPGFVYEVDGELYYLRIDPGGTFSVEMHTDHQSSLIMGDMERVLFDFAVGGNGERN